MLYGTSACHLCEQAEAVLAPWVSAGVVIECVDIADDDALCMRYGTLIPVLQYQDGRCLYWPFDAQQVASFLSE